jgi:hypothetical protein
MTRSDVYQILGLVLAALAIAIPLLDKTGAVNVPGINLQPGGGGSGPNPPASPLPPPPPIPEKLEVPDLTGLQEEAAKGTLAQKGLSGFRFSTTPTQLCSQESGEVESTAPPAGFKVESGDQVGLVVCE